MNGRNAWFKPGQRTNNRTTVFGFANLDAKDRAFEALIIHVGQG